jgi:hypothetical protein
MLRGSDETQERVMMLIGSVVLLCVVLAVLAVVVNPFGGRRADRISVVINAPYVGQGVQAGTAMVLHGVQVGEVTNTALSPGGGVRIDASLHKRPVAGLTDAMTIDFRPINYFGVPGVNIIPTPGGQAVRDGSEISLVPKGNFTLSELLSQLGDVSAAALTPRLITVVDRVTRYTDAFNPLFETMLVATRAVADVQRVSTTQLLANTATISSAVPPFLRELIDLPARFADFQYYPEHGDPRGIFPLVPAPSSPGASPKKLTPPFLEYTFVKNSGYESEEYYDQAYLKSFEVASGGLFSAVGNLLSTPPDDLLPLVDGLKAITDTTASVLRPDDVAYTLKELRSRLERLYSGNGEQRALQVRLLLDSLPGVAAPLGVQGVLPGIEAIPPTAALPAGVAGSPPGTPPVPPEVGGIPPGSQPHGVAGSTGR